MQNNSIEESCYSSCPILNDHFIEFAHANQRADLHGQPYLTMAFWCKFVHVLIHFKTLFNFTFGSKSFLYDGLLFDIGLLAIRMIRTHDLR